MAWFPNTTPVLLCNAGSVRPTASASIPAPSSATNLIGPACRCGDDAAQQDRGEAGVERAVVGGTTVGQLADRPPGQLGCEIAGQPGQHLIAGGLAGDGDVDDEVP